MSITRSDIQSQLETRAPGQAEFHQAVMDAAEDIVWLVEQRAQCEHEAILDRLIEPERIISFKVSWRNDDGVVEVNRGYRVQFNGSLGPYKGGLRFHPSVNESVLKFLAFEQMAKNALTGLPLGSAKGGADFDPRGRSEAEIERFCTAFMTELHHHIGANRDVPAGDINVGAREIGYLFGAYRRLTGLHAGALTGKSPAFGGSPLRPEATGYGLVYFVERMLEAQDKQLDDAAILISGAGNVALHAARKVLELGAKPVSLSNSKGALLCPDGLSEEALHGLEAGEFEDGLKAAAQAGHGEWREGEKPWTEPADIALPCATQNELDEDDAKALAENGVRLVAEGANMPCTDKARAVFAERDILFAPGKAANAGGVAVSGLEMIQNASREPRQRDDIDHRLKAIMQEIHDTCLDQGEAGAWNRYAQGANRAGFGKVIEAMLALGV